MSAMNVDFAAMSRLTLFTTRGATIPIRVRRSLAVVGLDDFLGVYGRHVDGAVAKVDGAFDVVSGETAIAVQAWVGILSVI
jgi:hypothetical protein